MAVRNDEKALKYISFIVLGSRANRWDETPKVDGTETPGRTPGWAETPRTDRIGAETPGMTPTPGGGKRRSRWDETPQAATPGGSTPAGTTPGLSTPGGITPMLGGPTPMGTQAMQMATPTPGIMHFATSIAVVRCFSSNLMFLD